MNDIRAISFSQKDCGKHLSDTKKRFVWDFQIDGRNYTLQLINSTLSGKRTIMLNMQQIYHQKNLLNIDFDFTHMISGHSFRISRIDDSLNKYELRIDNRTFDQVRLGKGMVNKSSSVLNYEKKSNDPFADFQSFAASSMAKHGATNYQTSKSNAFGDFDFQSFSSKPSTTTSKPSSTSTMKIQPTTKSSSSINTKTNSSNLLDFAFGQAPPPPKPQHQQPTIIPISDFQTNIFQTKTNNNYNTNNTGFDNFLQSFKQNQSNLLDDNDENQFATNAYVNRNYYLDLQSDKQQQSDKYFGDGFGFMQQAEEPKDRTIKQNLMEYNKMAGLAAKKAANTVAMKFNQIKKTINQSLI